jgi:hypothetical protein
MATDTATTMYTATIKPKKSRIFLVIPTLANAYEKNVPHCPKGRVQSKQSVYAKM